MDGGQKRCLLTRGDQIKKKKKRRHFVVEKFSTEWLDSSISLLQKSLSWKNHGCTEKRFYVSTFQPWNIFLGTISLSHATNLKH